MIVSDALSPWTVAGLKEILIFGALLSIVDKTSCNAAVDAEVITATCFGASGIGSLFASSKRPSSLSLFLSFSNSCIKFP